MPPKRARNQSANPSCTCSQPDNDEMIGCDICGVMLHLSCAGVKPDDASQEFQCKKCLTNRSTLTQRSPTQIHSPATNITPKPATANVDSHLRESYKKLKSLYDIAAADNKRLKLAQTTQARIIDEQAERIEAAITGINVAHQQREEQSREMEELKATIETLKAIVHKQQEEISNSSEVVNHELKIPAENVVQSVPEKKLADQLADFERCRKELDEKLQSLREPSAIDVSEIAARVASEVMKRISVSIPNLNSVGVVSESKTSSELNATTSKASSEQLSAPPTFSNVFDSSFNAFSQPSTTPLDRLAVSMNRQFLRKLPTFSGADEKEWPSFITIYESTTQQGQYSEADNLNRLREALRSPALDLVLDLVKFSTTATPIIEELRNAYGRPENLVVKFMDKLLTHQSIRHPTDVRLRQFAIDAKEVVANLKAMNRHADLINTFALEKLVAKLPFEHYKDWVSQTKSGLAENLETFANFLMEKVREIPPALFSEYDNESTARSTNEATFPSYNRVNAHQSAEKQKQCCIKCDGKHGLWNCKEFRALAIDQRWKLIKDRLCACCLESSPHAASDCSRRRKCEIDGCERYHHRLLHKNSTQSRFSTSWRSSNESTGSTVLNHSTKSSTAEQSGFQTPPGMSSSDSASSKLPEQRVV